MTKTSKIKLSFKKTNLITYIFSIFIFFIIIMLIINPTIYIQSVINGFLTFGKKVFPSLFPFFFLTKILIELNVLDSVSKILTPITKKLFNSPGEGAYVFLIGLICGYPVSAKITGDLFLSNKITTNDATKIASYTSTSGPMFVIGTVGASLFQNIKLGVLILICHIIGAILTGLIFCHKKNKKQTNVQALNNISTPKISTAVNNSMFNAINSVLIVGGFIVVFYCFIDIVFNLISLSGLARPLVSGTIEMTRGLIELSNLMLPFNLNLILGSLLISFGGFSIIMQAYAFLSNAKVSLTKFISIKIVHGCLSTFVAFLISIFI